MTGQSDAAAERSYHEPAAAAASAGPVVEVAPGVFKLACVAKLEAEIARLEVENRALRAWVEQQA